MAGRPLFGNHQIFLCDLLKQARTGKKETLQWTIILLSASRVRGACWPD